MKKTINRDFRKGIEQDQANRVNVNATKTHYCLLMHRGGDKQHLSFDGVKLEESWCSGHKNTKWYSLDTIYVQRVEKCSQKLGFFKAMQELFIAPDIRPIYATHIQPKLKHDLHVWVGAFKGALLGDPLTYATNGSGVYWWRKCIQNSRYPRIQERDKGELSTI